MSILERNVIHSERKEVIFVAERLIKAVQVHVDIPDTDIDILNQWIQGYLLIKGSAYWSTYRNQPQYKGARFIPFVSTMVNCATVCEYAGSKIIDEAKDIAAITRRSDHFQFRNLANTLTTIAITDGDDNDVSQEKLKEDDRVYKINNYILIWQEGVNDQTQNNI